MREEGSYSKGLYFIGKSAACQNEVRIDGWKLRR
jgi:hypothetical protein